MSNSKVIKNPSFEEKINDISNYLKDKVLNPAEKEKAAILNEANKKKADIIAEAEKEAKNIIDNAKKRSAAEQKNLESALRIAAKQAVNSLKLELEKEVLKKVIIEPSEKVLESEKIMESFIKEIINVFVKGNNTSDLSIVLSDKMKKDLDNYFKSETIKKIKNKIELSSQNVKAGFNVILKDGGIMYDFSLESIVELLSNYLRPELREYLFEKK